MKRRHYRQLWLSPWQRTESPLSPPFCCLGTHFHPDTPLALFLSLDPAHIQPPPQPPHRESLEGLGPGLDSHSGRATQGLSPNPVLDPLPGPSINSAHLLNSSRPITITSYPISQYQPLHFLYTGEEGSLASNKCCNSKSLQCKTMSTAWPFLLFCRKYEGSQK